MLISSLMLFLLYYQNKQSTGMKENAMQCKNRELMKSEIFSMIQLVLIQSDMASKGQTN